MLAFKAFVASEKGPSKNWEKLARHFLDTYVGQYESREDYAKVYLSESGEWGKIPPLFRDCFDFFLYARALFSSVVYDLKAQRGIYVFFNCKPESD
jgi:antirestriction protein